MKELTPQRFRALTKEKIDQIAKDNPSELGKLISDMRLLVLRQASTIYGRGYNPIAYENLAEKSQKTITGEISSSITSQKQMAIQLLNTYKSKTMTIRGAEEHARKEDIRIFGYDYKQTATGLHYKERKYSLSPAERRAFWAMYNQIRDEATNKESDLVLQAIEEVITDRTKGVTVDEDIIAATGEDMVDKARTAAIAMIIQNFKDEDGFDRDFIEEAKKKIKKVEEFSYS